MTEKTTPTPRTDAELVRISNTYVGSASDALLIIFARTLERELSAANAKLAEEEKKRGAAEHQREVNYEHYLNAVAANTLLIEKADKAVHERKDADQRAGAAERKLAAAEKKLAEEQEINSRLCRTLNEENGPTHTGEPVLRNNYHDAYRGARDEMQVWKARALTAEKKLAEIYAREPFVYHHADDPEKVFFWWPESFVGQEEDCPVCIPLIIKPTEEEQG